MAPSAKRSETGRLKRLRVRQMRRDARARAAQGQKAAVEMSERAARYMFWCLVLATICTGVTAAAVGYTIVSDLVYTVAQ